LKLPIAWLRDYLDIDLSSDDIAARFAALGFPVDAIERRPQLSGVFVGRLVRVEKHPGADRLWVCTVDVGDARPLTIATAATNVAAGNVVPVAIVGAELVGLRIAPRTMRGVASEGMLCSAAELGLEAAWFEDGILQLDSDLEAGADFVRLFGLNDDVLDVEITANRVDAMSIVGLARELAASLGNTVREPALREDERAHDFAGARVEIESADCKRFVAQRFSNVTVRTAPFWMRIRLALAGQRPINNLVDISNFVMLETAQPLHFYDFAHLAGGRLVVRDARPGEPIRTLDEADRALDERFLVIADDAEPQCIAGLKGAAASEVTPATRELLVESASFAGPRIRRMSVALGLRTEASSRQEKGLPLGLSTWGAARAAYLLEREGATVHAPLAAGSGDTVPAAVRLPAGRCEELLGMPVGADEGARALRGLGFTVANEPGGILLATPPFWRGDVRIAEDVVEEIARIVGYDRIDAVLPPVFEQHVSSAAYRDQSRVAHALASLGYREAVTLSLQPAAVRDAYARAGVALPGTVVEIRNPLSEDQRYLRFSLLPALLALAARGIEGEAFRVFEIGDVFGGAPGAEGELFETAAVTWLLALPERDEPVWRDSGFLAFKGESLALLRALTGRDAETITAQDPGLHPGKTASLMIDGKDVAAIGAVDPRLRAAFDVGARVYAGRIRFADLPAYHVPRYVAPSKFPPLSRDLALVVAPHVAAKDIEYAARSGANGAIADVRVFDEYRGPQVGDDKKSLAVRITLQRSDATLTDAEADAYVASILASLRERCGAVMRAT